MKETVWSFLLERVKRGQRAALLTIVDGEGASPGKPGFKMAVSTGRALCGSVGGGAVEYDLVEEARALLRKTTSRSTVARKVHRLSHAETSGMICGGEQKVAIVPCRASDRKALEALVKSEKTGEKGLLSLTPKGISFTPGKQIRDSHQFRQSGTGWRYEENLGYADTAYIVGGGHVCLALSRVLATLPFRIVVFDPRPDVLKANVHAHERCLLPFKAVARKIPTGTHSYVLIMTPSHVADDVVLRQLARKNFKYLGLMASKTKAQALVAQMIVDGFPKEAMARVRTPVGLPIGSHTPAEIAVSVSAEMIQVRNARA